MLNFNMHCRVIYYNYGDCRYCFTCTSSDSTSRDYLVFALELITLICRVELPAALALARDFCSLIMFPDR